MSSIRDDLRDTHCYNCLSCGRCTGSCPVSSHSHGFSPRMIVERAVMGELDKVIERGDIWHCWTCAMCREKCGMEVDFPELIKRMRERSYALGDTPEFPHFGMLHSAQSIMADLPAKSGECKLRELSGDFVEEVIFFRGCAQLQDIFFKDLPLSLARVEESVIKLLLVCNIKPVFVRVEKCCGHDLLWSGDHERFRRLAEHNAKAFLESGIKKLVTYCPECCHTLREEYGKIIPGYDITAMHWVELLQNRIDKRAFKAVEARVAYHDSCKMGRFLKLYEPPREIIGQIPGVSLVEMPENRHRAPCCGVSAWVSCSSYSKKNQTAILGRAKESNAELLLTSCPKCLIHLNCARMETARFQDIQIVDIAEFVSKAIM